MRNTYSKRRSSVFSFIAMILCLTMLLGTTMAWFTSSAVNEGNRIQAGELSVQLLKHDGTDYQDISGGTGDIFNAQDGTGIKWEPGRTEVVFLAVKNVNELAVNYTLIMDSINSSEPLAGALEYALLPNMEKSSFEALELTCWADILELEDIITDDVINGQCFVSPEGDLLSGETEYFTLAVHMKENASNDFQGHASTINIKVAARQKAYENDSFGNFYDVTAPYPGQNWQNIIPEGVLDFESGSLSPMTARAGDPSVVDGHGGKVLMLEPGERAQYSIFTLTLAADGEYKITGWYKTDNPNTPVTITVWTKNAGGSNDTPSHNLNDYTIVSTEDGWNYFEVPVLHAKATSDVQFILNNRDAAAGTINAGNVYFDDVQYVKTMSDVDLMLQQWYDKQAQWDAESMMVQDVEENPYVYKTPIGPNLLVNGNFSSDLNSANVDSDGKLWIVDKQKVAGQVINHPTGWEARIFAGQDIRQYITEDGAFYMEWPEGYSDTTVHKRIIGDLWQEIDDIVPGAQYQIKFKYRINPSNCTTATWYGPFVQVSSFGDPLPGVEDNTIDYKLLRVDTSPQGLETDGQWHEHSETVYISGQATSVGVYVSGWLYEKDWMEIDDVEFCLVDLDSEIELGYETKFFYDDMGTTTFSADLAEDMFPEIAADAGATVKFELFDGQTLVWNTEELALSGAGYVAEAEFDLSLMTKKAQPYVLKATLYDGNDGIICEVSERLYINKRPSVLDANGNYIKTDPNGNKLDFNLAYAVLQDHYDETLEIGSNVMSLTNARSAEQVLERLDFCLNYGYMGMVNLECAYVAPETEARDWVIIDVVSDERVRNHPALLGYCIADEPWCWTTEELGRKRLEEVYNLIRQYDTENIIFSVNNMVQFNEIHALFNDVMLVDPYEPAAGATVYNKVSNAVEAAGNRMPVWAVLTAFKNRDFVPSGDEARNNNWQAFIAGADGLGYYAISYGDVVDGTPIPMWDIVNGADTEAGQRLWNGLKSFKEKEWDIAYDHFADGEGADFNEKIAVSDGYIYSSWVVNGEIYLVVLNVKGEQVSVDITLTSDVGNVTVGAYSATVVNGSDQADFTGNGTLSVTMEKDQAILYKITPTETVDFTPLG